MRAIRQIVKRLQAQGLLDDGLLERLREQGLLMDEPPDPFAPEPEQPRPEPPDPLEDLPADPGPATRRARRRGRVGRGGHGGHGEVVRKGRTLTAKQIAAELETILQAARSALAPLPRLAAWIAAVSKSAGNVHKPRSTPEWHASIAAINAACEDVLDLAIGESLRRDDPGAPSLWSALAWSGCRDIVEDAHGPAVSAYHAILARPIDQVARYRWILKHPQVVEARDLARAQSRLLLSLGRMIGRAPLLLAPAIRQLEPPARWAAAIVYSARRGAPGDRPDPAPGEACCLDILSRMGPAEHFDRNWATAWAQAALMDPAATQQYLLEMNQETRRRVEFVARHAMGIYQGSSPEQRRMAGEWFNHGAAWKARDSQAVDDMIIALRAALVAAGAWRYDIDRPQYPMLCDLVELCTQSGDAADARDADGRSADLARIREKVIAGEMFGSVYLLCLVVLQPREWDWLWLAEQMQRPPAPPEPPTAPER